MSYKDTIIRNKKFFKETRIKAHKKRKAIQEALSKGCLGFAFGIGNGIIEIK